MKIQVRHGVRHIPAQRRQETAPSRGVCGYGKFPITLWKIKLEMRSRIYIDTSIVGGFFDQEFSVATRALFERLKNGEVVFVVSDVLNKELLRAPEQVRNLLNEYAMGKFEHVALTQEGIDLANRYVAEKVVGETSIDDCYHIAMATIAKVDVLASWNFKHIVNLERIKGYNGVNLKMGYAMIEIRNPKDLVSYGND
jgi:predicted nucleic acid-binding protein